MRRLLLFLVVLCALIFALPYIILPAIFENLAAGDIRARLELPDRPDVELESDPRWEALFGEFSGGRVSLGAADLGEVRAKDVSMDLDPFGVDMLGSLRRGAIFSRETISGRARVEVGEAEILRLVRRNAEVPVNGVEIGRGGVTVESETTALGTTFPVTVEGDVGVEGGALVFRPGTVRAAGVVVPEELADALLAGTSFRFPLEDLPYGATITGVRTAEGAVVLTGRVSGVELGRGG